MPACPPHPIALSCVAAVLVASLTWADDCNVNGVDDALDIADGTSADCNGNLVPDECDLATVLEPAPFVMDLALDNEWAAGCDDCWSPIRALPFALTIGDHTFTRFVQSSNGIIELLESGQDPDLPDYSSVEDLAESTDHTFILAAFDDLSSVYENFFGYVIEPGRITFRWTTETYLDEWTGAPSTFEVVLRSDGSVQWNFVSSGVVAWSYDLFSGMYLGSTDTVLVVGAGIPEQQSRRLDPDVSPFPQTVPYEFLSADRRWKIACDDCSDVARALPAPIDLAGETYVAFIQDANGYVELLRDGEAPYHFGYGFVSALTEDTGDGGGPEHSYLMAGYDDLDMDYVGDFGSREADGRVIFHWHAGTYADGALGLQSRFEMILDADGGVRWNFQDANYVNHDFDFFTGVYLGHATQSLVTVESGTLPDHRSFTWSGGEAVTEIPFEGLRSEARTLDWHDSEDDSWSPHVDLPWPVQLGAETYVSFVQNSNGAVELLREGESDYDVDYGDFTYLIHYTSFQLPEHTYLMAAYDDLTSEYGGVYGYRFESNRVIFRWRTETYDDYDTGRMNDFEIVLSADGSVRWNFNFAGFASFGYDLFSGLYIGHDERVLMEVARETIPVASSFLARPGLADQDDDGTPDTCGCAADLDGDGVVNVNDIVAAIVGWGECSGCAADFDDDGDVDLADLVIVILAWGACP